MRFRSTPPAHDLEVALRRQAELEARLPGLRAEADAEAARPVNPMAEIHADFLAREWGDDSVSAAVTLRNAERDLEGLVAEVARLRAAVEAEAAEARRREADAAEVRRREDEARRAEAEARRARYGAILGEGLLAGMQQFPRDVPLVRMIDADPGADDLLGSLREALARPGCDPYEAIRDVTNDLGVGGAGWASRMSHGANWRPDTVSGVARAVGVGRFVDALVARLRRM